MEMASITVLVLCCFFDSILSKSLEVSSTNGLFDGPEIFLTIRATAGTSSSGVLLDRNIELNWYNLPTTVVNSGWIGLFDHDPIDSGSSDSALFRLPTIASESGASDTGVKFERLDHDTRVPVANFGFPLRAGAAEDGGGACVGFWIAAFATASANTPTLVNCLKIYPNWMHELQDQIGNRRLSSVMIPGTHNAGAWKFYARGDDLNAITQNTYNQEDTIYSQLVHGIRYLDVRVGYQANAAEKFGIYHGIRLRPLSTLLADVRAFVLQTQEIVIMDFHRFEEGMDSVERHDELVSFVVASLGDLLVTKSSVSSNPSANEIWARRKYVMWTYPDGSVTGRYDFLWPTVSHAWGDKNTVENLYSYLNNQAIPSYGCKGRLWSSMAELTPTAEDIILKPLFGLRKYAQLVNPPVTDWFRSQSWYSTSNIVSTDFYLGNNIIEMSMKVNKNRASCPALP